MPKKYKLTIDEKDFKKTKKMIEEMGYTECLT